MLNTMTDAQNWAEYDLDGNQELEFDEFYAMQPSRIREKFGMDAIRKWFDVADSNGNGKLSVNEYFAWSLRNAMQVEDASMGLAVAFKKYDHDGTGELDATEFTSVCHDLGFGLMANQIFSSVDKDGSGTISYKELLQSFATAPPNDNNTKIVLTSLMTTFNDAKKEHQDRPLIDTSSWKIRGLDVTSTRAELQALLRKSGETTADLMRVFDKDGRDDGGPIHLNIDDAEFRFAMREKLGFRGKNEVLSEIFMALDENDNGQVGFHEIYEFIRGKRHSLDPRGRPDFEIELPLPVGVASLDDLYWDTDVLRTLIDEALQRCQAGAADLFRAWNGRRGLTRDQWEFKVQKSCLRTANVDLWVNELQPVISKAFDVVNDLVTGGNVNPRISVIHLERWLDGKSYGEGAAFNVRDRPNPYTFHTLPRKTERQLKQMHARRRQQARRDVEEAEAAAAMKADADELLKTDWVAKAQADLEAAAATAARREAKKREQAALAEAVATFDERWHAANSLPPLERKLKMESAYSASTTPRPSTASQAVPYTVQAHMLVRARNSERQRLEELASPPVGIGMPPSHRRRPRPPMTASGSRSARPRATSPRRLPRSQLLSHIRSVRQELEHTVLDENYMPISPRLRYM